MGLAETAILAVNMNLGGNFISKMGIATGQLNTFNTKAGTAGRIAGDLGRGAGALATNLIRLGAVGLGAIGIGVKQGLSSLTTLQSGITANEAAIKQMGVTGQVTATQIAGWAAEIEKAVGSAFDDKDINRAATTLLRFGKTAPQNLRPALQVVTDLATKTGSVDSAASLLAKALAKPEAAAGKLARAGVVLTKQQQKQIEAAVKAGDAAKAQAVILDALAKVTAGAALNSQDKYARSAAVLKDVVEDAERALATGFVPVIEKVRDLLSEELAKPSTLKNIEAFGKSLAGGLQSLIDTARGLPWAEIGAGLGAAGAGAKAIFDAFVGLPPDVKSLLIGFTALNKLSGGAPIKIGIDILQGAGGLLFQQFLGRGSVANPMFVVPVGGGLGGAGVAGAGKAGGLGSFILPVAAGLLIAEAITQLFPKESRDLGTRVQNVLGTREAIDRDANGNIITKRAWDSIGDKLGAKIDITNAKVGDLARRATAAPASVSVNLRVATNISVSDVYGTMRTHATYSSGMTSGVSGVGHGI